MSTSLACSSGATSLWQIEHFMRVMMKILLALLILFGSYSTARAAGMGNDLLVECNLVVKNADGGAMTSDQYQKAAHCLGIVEGVRDTLNLWQRDSKDSHFSTAHCTCTPDDVSNLQAVRVVLKYLQDNPDILHYSNTVLIALALQKAYPCKT